MKILYFLILILKITKNNIKVDFDHSLSKICVEAKFLFSAESSPRLEIGLSQLVDLP